MTLEQAEILLAKYVTQPHLLIHARAVSAAMGAMAEHFNEDKGHWRVIGYLHDVDYERYPEEHCQHVRQLLAPEGVSEADIRAIESHGWGLVSDVEPQTMLEKSLYTVDELTGIIQAAALMRPDRIEGMTVKSLLKKFKDKRFAAKCNREIILQGCDMLQMSLNDVVACCIAGMQAEADKLGLSAPVK